MQFLKTLSLAAAAMILTSCSTAKVDEYEGTKPEMAFDQYFDGPIKAWGIVQDRNGKVMKQFDLAMLGTWHGDTGSLEEHFKYYDGKIQDRVWHIHKVGPNAFEGTASDIKGKATGRSVGNAIQWAYVMKLDVEGKKYDVTFDDWMFQMHDGVLINRSYLKKFGITWGQLSIFMQKQ